MAGNLGIVQISIPLRPTKADAGTSPDVWVPPSAYTVNDATATNYTVLSWTQIGGIVPVNIVGSTTLTPTITAALPPSNLQTSVMQLMATGPGGAFAVDTMAITWLVGM